MTLTKFVKKYYHVFFEICLWIVLIASTISGFFSGNFLLYRYFGISVSQLFGGIIGLIFGLIIIVTIGGFSAIILNYFK
ncbi:MAG: hypothetical protein LBB89_13735, partial [Treponema sp.]|nr:hypothetical protein [Treponema sp.]